jgi:hypothetical protein
MKDALMDLARLGRWRLRRLKMRLQGRSAAAPVLFANSFPKSGTHLLTQVLAGFTTLGPFVQSGLPAVTMFDGADGRALARESLLTRIDRLRPGDIAYGHLHADNAIVEALCQPGMAPYFVLRDPRDVVVSHVFYVAELEPNHVLHQHYAGLTDFGAQLKTSILGLPQAEFDFPDIGQRFAPYFGWLDRREVLVLHYEDLISDQRAALRRILGHAIQRGFEYSGDLDAAVDRLAGFIDPGKSPTFRQGRSGGWRQHFTPEHTDLFKQVAGDLLIRLGYEEGRDW